MVQTYKEDCFGYSHIAAIDMTNIKNNFACLRSMFSGAISPSNPLSGYMWFCTTKRNLRVRSGSNNKWVGVLTGEDDSIILIYRNDTDDGFSIYYNTEDIVVGVKSLSGRYITGGLTASNWSISGAILTYHTHTDEHAHVIDGGAHNHALYGFDGGTIGAPSDPNIKDLITGTDGEHSHVAGNVYIIDNMLAYVEGSTWRPAAIVCTMQYLETYL